MKYAPIDKCSGPLWEPKLWNNLNDIPHLENANCYEYAFNYISYREDKLQPGELSSGKFKDYTCESIINKLKEDYKDVLLEKVKEYGWSVNPATGKLQKIVGAKALNKTQTLGKQRGENNG